MKSKICKLSYGPLGIVNARKRSTAVAVVLTLAVALALGATSAFAVHDEGIFQLDGDAGNATCSGNGPGISSFGDSVGCTGEDWDTLYTCTGGGSLGSTCTSANPCDANGDGTLSGTECTANHANAISVLAVDPAPLSIFIGGGSKDEKNITQWQWVNGNVPDKDDIIEAFAALYVAPPGTTRGGVSVAGHKIVYFGANRLAVSGDAQIGLWFLQNPVGLGGTGQHASPFVDSEVGGTASHKIGDILILSNFVQGGGSSNIQVYVVNKITTGKCPAGSVESKAGTGDICLTQLINGTAGTNGVCNSATASPAVSADAACAATNGAIVTALDPDFTAKAGADAGNYPIVGFFEGGLDLNALGLGGECFPTFLVETRSSQSITAVLKDFASGQFERCQAEIATEIHDPDDNDVTGTSVTPGTVIHDVATVTGTQGGPDPGSGGSGTCTASRPCTVTFRRFVNTLNNNSKHCVGGTNGGAACTAASECPGGSCAADIVGCSGTPTTETPALCVSDGAGSGTCTATSSDFTTVQPPGYSYLATYNGDSNYPPIGLPATSCEIVLVGKLESVIATDIYKVSSVGPPLVLDGTFTDNHIDLAGAATIPVVDQATVTPQTPPGGPTPTGTVTFSLFGNGACSGTATSTENITLNASGVATSSVFNLGANGLSYVATYGGDNIYNASTSSRCEPVCAIDTTQ
jgi:hypothetical protein